MLDLIVELIGELVETLLGARFGRKERKPKVPKNPR
mgnify:CR=1 FL=1